jgi:hypothetical protein
MVGGVSLRGGKAQGSRLTRAGGEENRWVASTRHRIAGVKEGAALFAASLQRVRVLALLGFRLCLRTAFRFRHVNPAHNRVTIDENAAEENGIRRRHGPLLHQRFQALD